MEELKEIIEMVESDLELTKEIGGVYDMREDNILSHNEIMKNLLADLKELVKD